MVVSFHAKKPANMDWQVSGVDFQAQKIPLNSGMVVALTLHEHD
jgi:hypothetical protein